MEHNIISRAMYAISENTCIKFEKRAGESDYIDLQNERGEGFDHKFLHESDCFSM